MNQSIREVGGRIAMRGVLAVWVLLVGSVWAIAEEEAAPPEPKKDCIELQVRFDKSEYRPGEMIVCQVELVNRYDAAMLVAQPVSVKQVRHSNLHFRLARKDAEQMYRRVPVVIQNPPLAGDMLVAQFESLQPGAGLLEKFAFVNLTRAEGEYVLFVEYESVAARDNGAGEAASDKKEPQKQGVSVEFSVKGPRLWKRDTNDLLTREEAIRVAQAKYGRPTTGARATLVETESNLLDWWVTLDRQSGDVAAGEGGARVGFYVSPYGGFVRAQAPALAVEPEQALKALMEERTRQFREIQRPASPLKSAAPAQQPPTGPPAAAPAEAGGTPAGAGGDAAGGGTPQ